MKGDIQKVRTGLWVCIFLFWALLIVFQFYAPSANTFVHRFDFDPVGVLTSTRWSFDFWVSAMYVFLWTVPITMAFILSDTNDSNRWYFHLISVGVLTIWLFIAFIYQCVDWSHANGIQGSNYFNPANDPRWCCVNYVLPNAPCANNAPCGGINANDLVTNHAFLYQLWMGFIFLGILVADIVFTLVILIPTFRAAADGESSMDMPLMEEAAVIAERIKYKHKQ
jgi:hypothetical protein